MNKKIINVFAIAAIITSCIPREEVSPKQERTAWVSSYKPLLMSRKVLETSVSIKPPRNIANPGKFYLYNQYILINEKYKGFHIIDNIDDKKPVNIGFISIPGSLDLAIKNNVAYADNATDLVAIEIHDLRKVTVSKRFKNTFKEPTAPDGGIYIKSNEESEAIIVGWEYQY